MRATVLALAILGCGGGPSDFQRSQAESLEKDLASLDAEVTARLKTAGTGQVEGAFPIQKAEAVCGETTVRLTYNPYRGALVVGVASGDAFAEQLRTISFDGKRAWETTRAKPSAAKLGDSELILVTEKSVPEMLDRDSEVFPDARTAFAEQLGGERPLDVELGLTTIATAKLDKGRFAYTPRKHRWRLVMQPFTPAMSDAIVKHSDLLRRARIEQAILDANKHAAKDLRQFDDYAKLVARYDELVRKTEAVLAAPMPHAQHAKTFALTPVGCAVAAQ